MTVNACCKKEGCHRIIASDMQLFCDIPLFIMGRYPVESAKRVKYKIPAMRESTIIRSGYQYL